MIYLFIWLGGPVLIKLLKIGWEINLAIGFRLKVIMKGYNSEKLLVINIRFDLYYIIECLETNIYDQRTNIYDKSQYWFNISSLFRLAIFVNQYHYDFFLILRGVRINCKKYNQNWFYYSSI